jgi:hypothetical protein
MKGLVVAVVVWLLGASSAVLAQAELGEWVVFVEIDTSAPGAVARWGLSR